MHTCLCAAKVMKVLLIAANTEIVTDKAYILWLKIAIEQTMDELEISSEERAMYVSMVDVNAAK